MKRHVNKLFIEAHLFLWSILNDFRCMSEGFQLLMTNFSLLIMYVSFNLKNKGQAYYGQLEKILSD